jgi:hypothetical protein
MASEVAKPSIPGYARNDDVDEERVLHVTENEAFGSLDDIYVLLWRAETTLEGMQALELEYPKFLRSRPDGIGLLTIVDVGTPMPASPVRKAIAAFLQAQGGRIKASAVLFDGNSLRASAVRSVATGLTLLAKPPFPHKFFVDALEVFKFLDRSLPERVRRAAPTRMVQGLSRLRARFASHAQGREAAP